MTHSEYVSSWYDFITELNSDMTGLLPVIQKKSQILQQVIEEKKPKAQHIVAFGLTPEVLGLANNYSVTVVEPSPSAKKFALDINKKLNISVVINGTIPLFKYDVVLGLNQYITYLDTDIKQQEHIASVFKLLHSEGLYLSTVRDYKNINTNKFVDEVFTMRGYYIMETRKWDSQTNYNKTIMVIIKSDDSPTKLIEIGPVNRKTIMFKDLARLCAANQGGQFQIHRSKIYKPLYSKSMQHIITCVKE